MTHSVRSRPGVTGPVRAGAGSAGRCGSGRVRRRPTMCDVDVIRVSGGARLAGEVHVVGAKNSALKLMAAALLARGAA